MKELLTALLCYMALSASAQMAQDATFKEEFKQHMLTPTEKPKLNFEQRDIIHHAIGGGALATIGIPVVTASILSYQNNPNMAITGFIFGGMATAGAVALHSLAIKKAVKYHKARKTPTAFAY